MNKKIFEISESIEKLEDIRMSILEDSKEFQDMSDSEKLTQLKEISELIEALNDTLIESFENEQEVIDFLSGKVAMDSVLVEECIEDESVDQLTEMNIRRLDKKTKIRLRTIQIAIGIAKANNDPLYMKYKKGVDLRKTYKQLILNKYGGKAYNKALSEL